MERVISKINTIEIIKTAVFDVLALAVVFLTPVFSHLFAIPIYYAEPMRLMLVLSIMFTSKRNAILIAAAMPFFSMLVSGHPVFYKALIMSGELMLNAFLFFFLVEKIKNRFTSMVLSIVLSKGAYYGLKIILLQLALMSGDVITTPIIFQLGVVLIFSLLLVLKKS